MWLELALWSWICFGYMHVLWLDHYHCSSVPSLSMETSSTFIFDAGNLQMWDRQTFWSCLILCKIYLLPRQIHALSCLFRSMSLPFRPQSVICCPPIWPRLSICFEIAISEGMVSPKRGNGLRVELSMCRTWRVFFRGLFSIWTMFSDAEESVWAFASVAYLLSCLFAISCFSHVHEAKAEIQTGTIHV